MSKKEIYSKEKLESFEYFLQNNTIPKIKKNPKTFLGIAKQPHYENVLSNIYSFYFNVNEEHNLKDLFISSFQELIDETELGKKKQINLSSGFDIYTEFRTNKGGRIDLLLQNTEQAIIVENKVYHHLNNDLDDYWDSINVNKIGIVLSLHRAFNINHSGFINITHLQFLTKVKTNSGKYQLEANDKFFVFLKDLFQNITNLSKKTMKEEDLNFYFENQEKINDIQLFHKNVYDYIKRQVIDAIKLLDGEFSLEYKGGFNEKRLRYYVCKDIENLMITVVFDEVLTKKKSLHLIVEMKHGLLNNRKKYKDIFSDEEKKQLPLNNGFYITNEHWAHFASKNYLLNDENIVKLSEFIKQHLEEDNLLHIFNTLKKHITNERNKAIT